jgi:hypothetical protein
VEAVDGVVRSVITNIVSSPEQSERGNTVPSHWTQILEGLNAGVASFCDHTRKAAMLDMESQINRQQEHNFWTGPGSMMVCLNNYLLIYRTGYHCI